MPICKKDPNLCSSFVDVSTDFEFFFFQRPTAFCSSHFAKVSRDIFLLKKIFQCFAFFRCFKIFYALFFTETKLFQLAFSDLLFFKAICAFLHVCHQFTTNSNTPRNYFDFFSKCPGIFGQKRPK